MVHFKCASRAFWMIILAQRSFATPFADFWAAFVLAAFLFLFFFLSANCLFSTGVSVTSKLYSVNAELKIQQWRRSRRLRPRIWSDRWKFRNEALPLSLVPSLTLSLSSQAPDRPTTVSHDASFAHTYRYTLRLQAYRWPMNRSSDSEIWRGNHDHLPFLSVPCPIRSLASHIK